MTEPPGDSARDAWADQEASIDDLIDRAVSAINRGDRAGATELAGQVLAADGRNTDAEDLLAVPNQQAGEIRRLTMFFADLVDSTVLSRQVEPETYRLLVGSYRDIVLRLVQRYEGHIGSIKGDGVLAVFGHPIAHEDDVRRAVLAGLDITREVDRLAQQARRRFGIGIAVRVGVHRGLVYVDTGQDDVYGLGANLAARVCGLAPAGAVVVSDAVESLVHNDFELEMLPPAPVKGIDTLVTHYRVKGERTAPATRAGQAPLVGRDREQARLQKSWTRAKAGNLRTPGVVLRGEPGIGKSRLAAEAIELVRRDGGQVLKLTGSPFHTDVGLHPVRTLLEFRCGIGRLTQPQERLALLEREIAARSLDPAVTVPLLAPVLGIAPEHGYEPVPADGRKLAELIAHGTRDYVFACFGGAPALLVAEDMHWFDPSTIELVGSVLGTTEGRVLVVMTGRPGDWLPPGWPAKMFELAPLTGEQTDRLVRALHPTVSAEALAAVRERCDGVPFYIEQVAAELHASGDAAGVPDALYEPLFARLRAKPNGLSVVQATGVIGREIDRRLLGSIVDLGEDELDDVIDELEAAMVLEPWGADGWRFRHELLREVAAELAPPSVRRSLHAAVADAIVQGVGGGDPDWRLAARHYEQAQRWEQAASAYQRASEHAQRRGALGEARAYISQAISHVDQIKPGPDRDRLEIGLRLQRGMLVSAAEGVGSRLAAADMERCLQLCGTDLSDARTFAAFGNLLIYYATRGDVLRADRIIGLLSPARQLKAFIGASGFLALLRGQLHTARPQIEEWVAVMAATSHQYDELLLQPYEVKGAPRVALAVLNVLQGDLVGADTELNRAADYATQTGFPKGPFTLAYSRFAQVWMCTESAQLNRAAVLAADLLELTERYGFDGWHLVGAAQSAAVKVFAALAAGDVDAADVAARLAAVGTSLDSWHAAGFGAFAPLYHGVLCRLLIAVGDLDEAGRRLQAGLQLAEETGVHNCDAELLRLRSHLRAEPDQRKHDIAASITIARQQGAHLFRLRAALDGFELRGQPAQSELRDAAGQISADSRWPELVRAQALLAAPRT